MSFYGHHGRAVRALLESKIENVLENDVDRAMILRFVPFVRLLKEISPTMTGEQRKEFNILYLTANTIYSVYYNYMVSANAARAQSTEDKAREAIDEYAEKFLNAMNEATETFLTNLKEIISKDGSKDRSTELFENIYNSIVEDVLNKYVM